MSQDPPPMPPAPPVVHPPQVILADPRKTDDDHLRILAVMHFVMAGLACLGLFFIAAHFAVMSSVFGNPEMWKNSKGGNPPPEGFFDAFRWMYLLFAVFIVGGGVLNGLSGVYLRKKKNRTFSFIVAGLNCMNMPLGTALGVFTFMVLSRPSVQSAYERGSSEENQS